MVRNKLLIALLIIILLVAYYILGMDYMKQRRQNAVLASQLTSVGQSLAQTPEPPRDLEQRLVGAQASLAARQSAFPDKPNSTQVINTILNLADDCEVKAIPLVASPWSLEDTGERGYYVFRLNVVAAGNYSQLVNFISKLENGQFKTLIVEDLRVTRVSDRLEAGGVVEGTIPVTASLDLAIYARPPGSDEK